MSLFKFIFLLFFLFFSLSSSLLNSQTLTDRPRSTSKTAPATKRPLFRRRLPPSSKTAPEEGPPSAPPPPPSKTAPVSRRRPPPSSKTAPVSPSSSKTAPEEGPPSTPPPPPPSKTAPVSRRRPPIRRTVKEEGPPSTPPPPPPSKTAPVSRRRPPIRRTVKEEGPPSTPPPPPPSKTAPVSRRRPPIRRTVKEEGPPGAPPPPSRRRPPRAPPAPVRPEGPPGAPPPPSRRRPPRAPPAPVRPEGPPGAPPPPSQPPSVIIPPPSLDNENVTRPINEYIPSPANITENNTNNETPFGDDTNQNNTDSNDSSFPTPPLATPPSISSASSTDILEPLKILQTALVLGDDEKANILIKEMRKPWQGMESPFMDAKPPLDIENPKMGPYIRPPRAIPPPILYSKNDNKGTTNDQPFIRKQSDDIPLHPYWIQRDRVLGTGSLPRQFRPNTIPPRDSDLNANPISKPKEEQPFPTSIKNMTQISAALLNPTEANDLRVRQLRQFEKKQKEIKKAQQPAFESSPFTDYQPPTGLKSTQGPFSVKIRSLPNTPQPPPQRFLFRRRIPKLIPLPISAPPSRRRIVRRLSHKPSVAAKASFHIALLQLAEDPPSDSSLSLPSKNPLGNVENSYISSVDRSTPSDRLKGFKGSDFNHVPSVAPPLYSTSLPHISSSTISPLSNIDEFLKHPSLTTQILSNKDQVPIAHPPYNLPPTAQVHPGRWHFPLFYHKTKLSNRSWLLYRQYYQQYLSNNTKSNDDTNNEVIESPDSEAFSFLETQSSPPPPSTPVSSSKPSIIPPLYPYYFPPLYHPYSDSNPSQSPLEHHPNPPLSPSLYPALPPYNYYLYNPLYAPHPSPNQYNPLFVPSPVHPLSSDLSSDLAYHKIQSQSRESPSYLTPVMIQPPS